MVAYVRAYLPPTATFKETLIVYRTRQAWRGRGEGGKVSNSDLLSQPHQQTYVTLNSNHLSASSPISQRNAVNAEITPMVITMPRGKLFFFLVFCFVLGDLF